MARNDFFICKYIGESFGPCLLDICFHIRCLYSGVVWNYNNITICCKKWKFRRHIFPNLHKCQSTRERINVSVGFYRDTHIRRFHCDTSNYCSDQLHEYFQLDDDISSSLLLGMVFQTNHYDLLLAFVHKTGVGAEFYRSSCNIFHNSMRNRCGWEHGIYNHLYYIAGNPYI